MQFRTPNRGGRFGRPNQLQPRRQAILPAINQQPGPPAIPIKPVGQPQPQNSGALQSQVQDMLQSGAIKPPDLYGQSVGSGGIQPGGGLLNLLKQQGASAPNISPFQTNTAQAPTGDRQNMAVLDDSLGSAKSGSISKQAGDIGNQSGVLSGVGAMTSAPQSPQGFYGDGGIQPGGGLLNYMKQQGTSAPNPSPFQAGTSTPSAPQSPQSFYGDRQNMSVLDDSSPSSNQYQAGTAMASVPKPSQGFYGGGGIQPGGGLLAQMKSGQPSSNPSQGFYGGGAPGGLLSGMKNAGGFQTPGMGTTPPKPSFGGSGGFPGGGAAGRFRGPTK